MQHSSVRFHCSGLGLFLLPTTTFFGPAAAAANLRLVSGPFNATAYNRLIECFSNVFSSLHIAIDKGVVVVIPPEGESIET
ncbi:hypothetical protein K431DRAFT_288167 [Polychaeton citri CBS 116435]|uniref:Uncharacterized protein n=1 Tax=Polychaeton citri CBS 116435 TaxID=1314669 RepID=A0A9P4Q404_9PEZI|nr:hypothetical protein K431DRAFT_288167 [Polychaeton citri CBS 116435]